MANKTAAQRAAEQAAKEAEAAQASQDGASGAASASTGEWPSEAEIAAQDAEAAAEDDDLGEGDTDFEDPALENIDPDNRAAFVPGVDADAIAAAIALLGEAGLTVTESSRAKGVDESDADRLAAREIDRRTRQKIRPWVSGDATGRVKA